MTKISLSDFDALDVQIGDGLPGAEQNRQMGGLLVDIPQAKSLACLNPFKPEYKAAAMQLYLDLRGRKDDGYLATRDEVSNGAAEGNVWTDTVPWSFQDASMTAEHVHAWAHILSHLNLPEKGSLLEYGPGTGQILIMAARMGYASYGVDVNPAVLDAIAFQASHLGLPIQLEAAEFGNGFADSRFDTILFYEAFHHAFEFEALLLQLHQRLKPGGRLILCGEPVLHEPNDVVPYPWGPRLDALSLFCIRRFGWMELGFDHDYLDKVARLTGWTPTYHPFPGVARASLYVFEETSAASPTFADRELLSQLASLEREIAALRGSTSWRLTSPLRQLKEKFARARRN